MWTVVLEYFLRLGVRFGQLVPEDNVEGGGQIVRKGGFELTSQFGESGFGNLGLATFFQALIESRQESIRQCFENIFAVRDRCWNTVHLSKLKKAFLEKNNDNEYVRLNVRYLFNFIALRPQRSLMHIQNFSRDPLSLVNNPSVIQNKDFFTINDGP
jgi:hypothetical protein